MALAYASVAVLVVVTLSSFSFANDEVVYGVEVSDCGVNDQGPDFLDPPDFEKDVASCTYEIKDLDGDGYDDLEVQVSGGYPGYECEVNVTLHNAGSEALEVTGIAWTAPAQLTVTQSQPTTYPVPLAVGGDTVVVYTVAVEQSAAQDTGYAVQGTITVESVD